MRHCLERKKVRFPFYSMKFFRFCKGLWILGVKMQSKSHMGRDEDAEMIQLHGDAVNRRSTAFIHLVFCR